MVNVRDGPWLRNEAYGWRRVFDAGAPERFEELGIKIAVLEPGKPSGRYHHEEAQEAFLVLAGTCVLRVEGEERQLRAWDFFHCPPGTAHSFVGAGEGPCVLLMTGARRPGLPPAVYPEDTGTPPRWVDAAGPAGMPWG